MKTKRSGNRSDTSTAGFVGSAGPWRLFWHFAGVWVRLTLWRLGQVRQGARPLVIRPANHPPADVWFGAVGHTAICLGRHICFEGKTASDPHLAHEYQHTRQVHACGGFWRYLWLWCRHTAAQGYQANPFEVQAYRAGNPAHTDSSGRTYGPGDRWEPTRAQLETLLP